MDAFESVVAMLLRREGYWIIPSFKVDLTKADKRAIGRHSSPRWEIDIVAYKGATNEVLAIECKSFLDSKGVIFKDGTFQPTTTYKMFTEPKLRRVVLRRIGEQLVRLESCRPRPKVRLGLAAGKIAKSTDRRQMESHFKRQGWTLCDDNWIRSKLSELRDCAYEDDVAFVVAKLALRK
jgi:hypothetical protein